MADFHLEADDDGNDIVVFSDDLVFCRGLRMYPSQIEPELGSETWLVLAFAIWSNSDHEAIQIAVDETKLLSGKIKLAVRPFNVVEEFISWCPEVCKRDGRSPIWILYEEGHIRQTSSGPMTSDELKRFLEHD